MSIYTTKSTGEQAPKSKRALVIGLASMFLGSIWIAHFIESREPGVDSRPFGPAAASASEAASPADTSAVPAGTFDLQVAFSPGVPGHNAESLVVGFVDGVKSGQLLFADYEFTSGPIKDALLRAEARGVDVLGVLDKSQVEPGKFSQAPDLAAAGVRLVVDCVPAIMHDKFMVANAMRVETGSFNYTAAAAKRNAENAIAFTDVERAKEYQAEWVRLERESQPFSAGACR